MDVSLEARIRIIFRPWVGKLVFVEVYRDRYPRCLLPGQREKCREVEHVGSEDQVGI